MPSVETYSPETAYATKDNIVVPPETAPSAAHLTALAARAVTRLNDSSLAVPPTVTAVKALKKG